MFRGEGVATADQTPAKLFFSILFCRALFPFYSCIPGISILSVLPSQSQSSSSLISDNDDGCHILHILQELNIRGTRVNENTLACLLANLEITSNIISTTDKHYMALP